MTGNPKNRYPDLTVLQPEHFELTRQGLTVTLDMPPPLFVAEAVSPNNTAEQNYQRDYVEKQQQYQDRGIPEYCIIDPTAQIVTLLSLKDGTYQATEFRGDQTIPFKVAPDLNLTATQILQAN